MKLKAHSQNVSNSAFRECLEAEYNNYGIIMDLNA